MSAIVKPHCSENVLLLSLTIDKRTNKLHSAAIQQSQNCPDSGITGIQ